MAVLWQLGCYQKGEDHALLPNNRGDNTVGRDVLTALGRALNRQ
jgi:hypothetical protein